METQRRRNTRLQIKERLEGRGAKILDTFDNTLIACYPHEGIGIFVFVVVKGAHTDVRPEDMGKVREWRRYGAISFLSCDPETIIDLIEDNIRIRTAKAINDKKGSLRDKLSL